MVPKAITDFLDSQRIAYDVMAHDRAFTAQGVAATLHVRGRDFAKAVIVKTGAGRRLMVVIPAPRHVDLTALSLLVGDTVELDRESEFASLFPGCEPGAEPPLGNLYHLPVYVDESLRKDPEIVFNAGTHAEAIRMRFADYERLVHPEVARLATAH
jgi:Ala-tRNA(Pro) deacylase